MKCPTDQSSLLIADRHGIEIDYCPDCRGVWLDRGGLDKIIARAGGDDDRQVRAYEAGRRAEPARHDDDREEPWDSDGHAHRTGRRRPKRESFLGELFDFG